METGKGDGVAQTTRLQPTSGSFEHAPASVAPIFCISCTDLLRGGRAARAAPSLCKNHMPPYTCTREQCDQLHMCRLFLDGFCPLENFVCRWGHWIKAPNNWNALESHQLQSLPEDDLLWLARSLMRASAPVSDKEYRRELALCETYSANAQCSRRDCFLLHLCPRLVEGSCKAGSSCFWNHRLDNADNVIVLLRLKCANMSTEQVLDLLARHPFDRSEVLGSSSGVGSHLTSSSELEGPDCCSSCACGPIVKKVDAEVGCAAEDSIAESAELTSTPLKKSADSVGDARLTAGSTFLTTLDLCLKNIHPSVCKDDTCTQLHLCRLFAAGMCPYDEKCSSGHEPCSSAHNISVLERHMCHGVSESDVLEGVRKGYLTRHPIMVAERQLALQMCRPYQSASCSRSDCARLHICTKYVNGTCKDHYRCVLSHDLGTAANAEIVKRVGLESLPRDYLWSILACPVLPKDVHRALTAGSDDVGLEWLSDILQSRPLGCDPHLSGLSSSLPMGADHTNTRHLSDSTAVLDPPQSKSATKEDAATPRATSDGHSRETTMRVATSIDVCHAHVRPSGCHDDECHELHVCRLFIAGVCPYGEECGRGHKVRTPKHNKDLLQHRDIPDICEADLLSYLRSGYLARNPLTEDERHSALEVCCLYQMGNCQNTKCPRLHICNEYAMGKCMRRCGLSHQISSPSHAVIMRRLGLASMHVRNVLKIFQKRLESQQSEERGDQVCGSFQEPFSRAVADSDSKDKDPDAVTSELNSANTTSGEGSEFLCDVHSSGNRCVNLNCYKFHLCGYYLADACKRPSESCPLGHDFQTKHNVRVMQHLGMVKGSLEELQAIIDQITLQARITFKNGAHKKVKLCIPYSSPRGCSRSDNCKSFHVCHDFVAGRCVKTDCALHHSLVGYHNRRVRNAIGLAASNPNKDPNMIWATDRDLIELMRAKLSLNPGVYTTDNTEASGTTYPRRTDQGTAQTFTGNQVSPILPPVCEQYGSTTGCFDLNCEMVHICPHFLANSCRSRRCRPCTLEHRLSSLHNREVLKRAGWLVTSENQRVIMKMLYEFSPHVQRTEVYDRLRLCSPHNGEGCWSADCMFIHICQKYIVGTCLNDGRCVKGHSVEGVDNMRKLVALGLADVSADEVLEMLRAVHAGPSVSPNATNLENGDLKSKTGASNDDQLSQNAASMHARRPTIDRESQLAGEATVGMCSALNQSQSDDAAAQHSVLGVCRQYSTASGCSNRDCAYVHICPHFLARACRRGQRCQLGHDLNSEHNQKALREAGVEAASSEARDELLDMLYTISAFIHRIDVYEQLRVCVPYNTNGAGCRKQKCVFLHVCSSFVAGTCKDEACEKDHHLRSARNTTMLNDLGLGATSSYEVLEMLRAIHAWRPMCGGSSIVGDVPSLTSHSLSEQISATSSVASADERPVLVVCEDYGTVAGCFDLHCRDVHICPHYVAGACRRADRCVLGHLLNIPHNLEALRDAGYEAATKYNKQRILDELHSGSLHIPQTATYFRLRVCNSHITKRAGCQLKTCTFIHICSHFVAGTCRKSVCPKGHDIETNENRAKLRVLGLDYASSDGVLEMLRAVHDWKSACTPYVV